MNKTKRVVDPQPHNVLGEKLCVFGTRRWVRRELAERIAERWTKEVGQHLLEPALCNKVKTKRIKQTWRETNPSGVITVVFTLLFVALGAGAEKAAEWKRSES